MAGEPQEKDVEITDLEIDEVGFDSDGPETDDQDKEQEEPHTEGDDTEKADDDGDTDDDTEEGDDDADGDLEPYESEEEFLKQFKLPGDPKNLEDAITSYKALVDEFNRLKQGQSREKQPDEATRTQQNQSQSQGYFKRDPFTQYVKSLDESGALDPDVSREQKSWASTMDKVLNGHFDQVEAAFNTLAQGVMKLTSQQRNASYNRLPGNYKKLVSRDELDKTMDELGLLDYAEALRYRAVNDPHLLSEFAKQERARGAKEQKRKGKGFKRFQANRRSAPSDKGGAIHERFLTPDGQLDEDKMNRLNDPTGDKKLKIANSFLAQFKQK